MKLKDTAKKIDYLTKEFEARLVSDHTQDVIQALERAEKTLKIDLSDFMDQAQEIETSRMEKQFKTQLKEIFDE